MTLLIDTHAHLSDVSFQSDLAEVLNRAHDNGVSAVIAVAENYADSLKNLALAMEYTMIKPAAGLYPAVLDFDQAEKVITFIRTQQKELMAIGEIGLDFWLAKTERERSIQTEIFSQFIQLGKEVDLPLNIHSRSAGHVTIEFLLEHDARRVQLHAFDGKVSSARPAIEGGYFFSIPPSLVRSRQKQKLVRHLPLECLLLESDSPVLGPVPDRRNEPGNIAVALEAIAGIKHISVTELAETLRVNTIRLYGPRIVT